MTTEKITLKDIEMDNISGGTADTVIKTTKAAKLETGHEETLGVILATGKDTTDTNLKGWFID